MATVIFPLAFFLRKLSACLLTGMALTVLPTQAQQVSIALDSIEHSTFNARKVRVAFDALHPGAADVEVAELRIGDNRFLDLKLHCNRFRIDGKEISCGEGTLRSSERPLLSFSLDYRFDGSKLRLTLRDAEVSGGSSMSESLRRWHPVGRFDLRLTADREQANFDVALRGLGFNTDDFSIAGEGIAGTVSVAAQRAGKNWQWQATADWSGGEAFWSPWYRKAGVRLSASGAMTPEQIQVDRARVTLDRLGSLTAGITWNRKDAAVSRWGFVTDPLDLAVAVKEWVQPMLEARALPGISASGTTRYAAEWANGALQSFYAGIENASFRESSGRLALTQVNASIPWSRYDESLAELSVGGGTLDDFPLGGFRLPVRLHGFDVAISRAEIPFLDGRINIDDFHAVRPGTRWIGNFAGGIAAVSMPRLTAAMKLPPMAGSMSMRIPAAEYSDHVLNLGGDMSIDLFDGRIVVRHLKLVDPLSKTSRFVADLEARNLNLGLITSTFSFGSILGRIDADIKGLELQGWKPLAFRARIDSSPGNYRRAISRGALIDISALGGAAGAAAVRAIPAAGLFNTFSYDRIGLGCALKDGICNMEGLHPEQNGFVLLEGSGIPAVKVMGYNRNIDWNLLMSRLKAVIAGKTKAVIE